MKPVVDRLEQEYSGAIDFYVYPDVNADAEVGQLADAHGISAVPTMVLVAKDGTEIDRIVGSLSESDFRARLDQAR